MPCWLLNLPLLGKCQLSVELLSFRAPVAVIVFAHRITLHELACCNWCMPAQMNGRHRSPFQVTACLTSIFVDHERVLTRMWRVVTCRDAATCRAQHGAQKVGCGPILPHTGHPFERALPQSKFGLSDSIRPTPTFFDILVGAFDLEKNLVNNLCCVFCTRSCFPQNNLGVPCARCAQHGLRP